METEIDIWRLAAGLGLFLFGMQQLEQALKLLTGRPFKKFLREYTQHPVRGVLAGAVSTAALQSSSVVSLIVLCFIGVVGKLTYDSFTTGVGLDWGVIGSGFTSRFRIPSLLLFLGELAVESLLVPSVDAPPDQRPQPEHDQAAEKNHHENDGRQPELLPLSHEGPEVGEEFEHQKGFSSLSSGLLALGTR